MGMTTALPLLPSHRRGRGRAPYAGRPLFQCAEWPPDPARPNGCRRRGAGRGRITKGSCGPAAAPEGRAAQIVVGTMGFEPTTSSTRSWQYAKLTYVPGRRHAARVLSLCDRRAARYPYDSSFTSNDPSGRLPRSVTKPFGLRKSMTPSIVPCHPQT